MKTIQEKNIQRLSFVGMLLTFALINWGGVVHNTQSSLACPDWPTCYSSFFPKMEGQILIEHGHRLLATLVGIITIGLIILARKTIFSKLTWLMLLIVICQGLLGGITVIYKLPTIVSTLHLATSVIFFALMIYLNHLSVGSSRQKLMTTAAIQSQSQSWNPMWRHSVLLSLFFVYTQMILGAFMRHSGAGAACGFGFSNSLMCTDISTWSQTFFPTMGSSKLHMVHRAWGVISWLSVFITTWRLRKIFTNNIIWIWLPLFFVTVQVLLGILTVAYSMQVIPTTLHLTGAMLSFFSLWKLNLMIATNEEAEVNKHSWLSDYLSLAKLKLASLVMMTVMIGMIMAPVKVNFFHALEAFLEIFLVVAGAAALNCYLEKDVDALMERTKDRPLPAGRMSEQKALSFGLIFLFLGIALTFYRINILTGLLSCIAAASYLYGYTPLKKKSAAAVYVGAIPGAIPPLLGWTAMTGTIDILAFAIFLIIFFWQLPHFLAISLYHADDYKRANLQVYPNHKSGIAYTMWGIPIFTFMLAAAAIFPATILQNGFGVYLKVALFLNLSFFFYSIPPLVQVCQKLSAKEWARNYFYGSIIYLPLMMLSLIFFK